MRQRRRLAKWERRLSPLLEKQLEPLANRLVALEVHLQLLQRTLDLQHPEQLVMLKEVLNSLQPPPEQQIAQLLGLPKQPLSPPSSVS